MEWLTEILVLVPLVVLGFWAGWFFGRSRGRAEGVAAERSRWHDRVARVVFRIDCALNPEPPKALSNNRCVESEGGVG